MQLPPDASGQVLACPHCDAEFTYCDDIGDDEPQDVPHEDELDAIRIKRLMLERRSAIRARSYLIMAAVGCAVGVLQLVFYAVQRVRATGSARVAGGFAIFAILFFMGMVMFIRKAREQ